MLRDDQYHSVALFHWYVYVARYNCTNDLQLLCYIYILHHLTTERCTCRRKSIDFGAHHVTWSSSSSSSSSSFYLLGKQIQICNRKLHIAGKTRLKYSTNSRPKGNITTTKIKVQTQNTNIRLNTQRRSKQCCEHVGKKWHLKAENSYVKLRKLLKSTPLIVRLNAVSEEKSTVSHGKQFQMLTTPSAKMRTWQCLYTGV